MNARDAGDRCGQRLGPVALFGERHHHPRAAHLALERIRAALCDDAPAIDDQHAVAERVGLLEVVGCDHDRRAGPGERAHVLPEVRAALRVEARRRLVEEDDVRLVDDAERHVQSPSLTARVGLDAAIGEGCKIELLED